MKVKSNPNLRPRSKEFTITDNFKEIRETGQARIHTDHTSQIKYILELAERYEKVEILNKNIVDGEITAIQAKIPVSFLSLKSKPRTNTNISSTVSMPSAAENSDFLSE